MYANPMSLFQSTMFRPQDESADVNDLNATNQYMQSPYGMTNSFGYDGGEMPSPLAAFGDFGMSQTVGSGSMVPPGLMASISQALNNFFGINTSNATNSSLQSGVPQMFTNFSTHSVGDPHDAFQGTTSDGNTLSSQWDNMASHKNLLCSPSFPGGFQISSQTTPANSQGITMNGCVTVHTDNGRNAISLDASGNASVIQDNQWVPLQANTPLTLNDGTQITQGSDKSLTVTKLNTQGGSLTTTLSLNGQGGVDIQANGSQIAVGGYLVRGNA